MTPHRGRRPVARIRMCFAQKRTQLCRPLVRNRSYNREDAST